MTSKYTKQLTVANSKFYEEIKALSLTSPHYSLTRRGAQIWIKNGVESWTHNVASKIGGEILSKRCKAVISTAETKFSKSLWVLSCILLFSPSNCRSARQRLCSDKQSMLQIGGISVNSWFPNHLCVYVHVWPHQCVYVSIQVCVYIYTQEYQFSSVQSLSRVWLFATPWTAACQASLSITNS